MGGLTFTLLPLISQDLICGAGVDASDVRHDADRSSCRRSSATSDCGPRSALGILLVVGSAVAFVVQPIAAALSDYTRSRLGRRRPWILVGTVARRRLPDPARPNSQHASWRSAVLIVLLQFSSNLAQGPFQGYVPDLVPEEQVGLASGLVGMMTVSGQLLVGAAIAGVAIAARRAVGWASSAWPCSRSATMLPAVFGVADRPVEMPKRASAAWSMASSGAVGEAWGHRSFVWLLVSRFFILMTAGSVTASPSTS